jgi:hypothetical protein
MYDLPLNPLTSPRLIVSSCFSEVALLNVFVQFCRAPPTRPTIYVQPITVHVSAATPDTVQEVQGFRVLLGLIMR